MAIHELFILIFTSLVARATSLALGNDYSSVTPSPTAKSAVDTPTNTILSSVTRTIRPATAAAATTTAEGSEPGMASGLSSTTGLAVVVPVLACSIAGSAIYFRLHRNRREREQKEAEKQAPVELDGTQLDRTQLDGTEKCELGGIPIELEVCDEPERYPAR